MKTIQELRDDLSHKVRSAEDLQNGADKGNRPFTAEETKAIKGLHADAETLKAEIASLEEQQALRDITDRAVIDLARVPDRKTPTTQPRNEPSDEAITRTVPFGQRFGSLKAFKGKDADLHAYKSAMWLAATLYGNAKADRWLVSNYGPNWKAVMVEGTNTLGGFLVPDEMSQAIIDLRETYGVFRRHTRMRAMASDTLTVPRVSGHVTASFTAEATAITASDMAFDSVMLVAKKLAALSYVSTELVEDAVVSIVDELARDMAWAFALKEDQCGFIGDGTSTYGGIVGLTNIFTEASGLAGAVMAAAGHDTFAEIDASDIAALMGALPEYARMNAKFYGSRVAIEVLFGRLKQGAGGNTIQTLQGTVADNYVGYEIVGTNVLPTSTGTINGTAMMFFGDLALASSMGERRGITVKRSDEIRFVEDQIAIKATERIDINIHDYGTTTAAGPIVALIGNT